MTCFNGKNAEEVTCTSSRSKPQESRLLLLNSGSPETSGESEAHLSQHPGEPSAKLAFQLDVITQVMAGDPSRRTQLSGQNHEQLNRFVCFFWT